MRRYGYTASEHRRIINKYYRVIDGQALNLSLFYGKSDERFGYGICMLLWTSSTEYLFRI